MRLESVAISCGSSALPRDRSTASSRWRSKALIRSSTEVVAGGCTTTISEKTGSPFSWHAAGRIAMTSAIRVDGFPPATTNISPAPQARPFLLYQAWKSIPEDPLIDDFISSLKPSALPFFLGARECIDCKSTMEKNSAKVRPRTIRWRSNPPSRYNAANSGLLVVCPRHHGSVFGQFGEAELFAHGRCLRPSMTRNEPYARCRKPARAAATPYLSGHRPRHILRKRTTAGPARRAATILRTPPMDKVRPEKSERAHAGDGHPLNAVV